MRTVKIEETFAFKNNLKVGDDVFCDTRYHGYRKGVVTKLTLKNQIVVEFKSRSGTGTYTSRFSTDGYEICSHTSRWAKDRLVPREEGVLGLRETTATTRRRAALHAIKTRADTPSIIIDRNRRRAGGIISKEALADVKATALALIEDIDNELSAREAEAELFQ